LVGGSLFFNMDKKFIEAAAEKLNQAKADLEKQLGSFAEKSLQKEGDWDAKMPLYNGGIEEEADEVEEFAMRLSLGNTLEEELKKVNAALVKIKKGTYGICDKCGKPIAIGRLEVYPQADCCSKCQ
jgi:RNA polymerase-binding transcription factor DksA